MLYYQMKESKLFNSGTGSALKKLVKTSKIDFKAGC